MIKSRRAYNTGAYLSLMLLGLYISIYQNVSETMVSEHNLNATAQGFMVSLHFIGSFLTPLLFGRISDRFGSKPVLILSYVFVLIGLVAICLPTGLVGLLASIFLIGSGYSGIEGLHTSILPRMNPGDGERYINRSQMMFCVGSVVGPLVSGFGVESAGWRTNYWSMAALFLAAMVFILTIYIPRRFEDGTKIADDGSTGDKRISLMSPMMLALCAAMAVYVGVEQGVAFFMGNFFSADNMRQLSSLSLSGYWLGMTIGRFVGGVIKKGHANITFVGLLLGIPVMLAMIIMGASLPTAFLFFAIGLLISMTWTALTAMAARYYRERSGGAIGNMMTAGATGGAIFPYVMGLLAQEISITATFVFMLALLVSCAALFFGVMNRKFRV